MIRATIAAESTTPRDEPQGPALVLHCSCDEWGWLRYSQREGCRIVVPLGDAKAAAWEIAESRAAGAVQPPLNHAEQPEA